MSKIMIYTHREILPSFGILEEDQMAVCKYTVLSVNEEVGDCAAYQGVGPAMDKATEADRSALMERIKAGGSKIPEARARELFKEIEEMQLHYRL